MKRELIIAESVNAAIANGVEEISVAADAMVTPSAMDKAHEVGLRITRQPRPPCPLHEGAPVNEKATCPSRSEDMAEIKKYIFAAMPEARSRGAQVDALIREALVESAPATSAPPAVTAPVPGTHTTARPNAIPQAHTPVAAKPRGATMAAAFADTPAINLPGRPVRSAALSGHSGFAGSARSMTPPVAGARPFHAAKPESAITRLGGALVADADQLPWASFAGNPEYINMVDITDAKDGLPMRLGYMEWESASFAWTAERDEVRLVLRGCLTVTLGDKELRVGAGSALYLPRGCHVVFSSTEPVRFACIGMAAGGVNQQIMRAEAHAGI